MKRPSPPAASAAALVRSRSAFPCLLARGIAEPDAYTVRDLRQGRVQRIPGRRGGYDHVWAWPNGRELRLVDGRLSGIVHGAEQRERYRDDEAGRLTACEVTLRLVDGGEVSSCACSCLTFSGNS